jgi:hypothetical protein
MAYGLVFDSAGVADMNETLKLALDALEYHTYLTRPINNTDEAITAIKAALAQQEPVALVISGVLVKSKLPKNYTGHLYITPPQRPWVGLTEARAKEIWLKGKDHGDDWLDVLALARAFEAELKELNT